MKNFICKGHVLDYTVPPATTIKSGDVVIVGNIPGVAVNDGAEGDVIAVNVEGVYELPKKAALAINQGDAVYWDSTPGEVTKTDTDANLGVAWVDAESADATVQVRLGIKPGIPVTP